MQRISVTARLNRSTLQFDEAAYARLASYFDEAARTLAGNPDQAEILSDLEQAIADRCKQSHAVRPGRRHAGRAGAGAGGDRFGAGAGRRAGREQQPRRRRARCSRSAKAR